MDKTGYFLLKLITWIFRLFPLRVHYIMATFFYFLIYHIFRYRRDVIESNLLNSFPDKSSRERTRIAKHFYLHFCDVFIETLYFDRISVKQGKDVVNYINADLPDFYMNQGRQVVVILGHYNNWEWYCNWPLYSKYQFYPVYKKIKSRAFEQFYLTLRSRFGAIPLERSLTFRKLMDNYQSGIPTMSAFLFDQTPRIHEIQHWVTFLNQETPVILGAEKIARKTNAIVLFANSHKIMRGKYEVEYQLVTDNPSGCAKFEITEKCIKLLEKQINEHPEFWLWSHKRWKHKRK